jgi:hypothetical protein
MSGIANQVGGYKQITATGNVSPIGCKLLGIFVSSSTVGTTTTSTKVVDTTVALTGGTWVPMPIAFASGIYIVVGGTLSATVVYA